MYLSLRYAMFLLFFGSLATTLQAQLPEQFSTNPRVFMDELEEVLEYRSDERSEEAFKVFEELVDDGKIPINDLETVRRIGNEMLSRKMRDIPFRYLLKTVNSMILNEELRDKHLLNWLSITERYIKELETGKLRIFTRYLSFSYDFFELNLLSNSGHKWKAESRNFEFLYVDSVLSINYPKTNIYCYNRSDSLTIKDVSGVYYPLEGVFKGESGRVDWDQPNAEDAYCIFDAFSFETKRPSYEVENVTLHFASTFNMPVEGSLSDRMARRSNNPRLSYPRFTSYAQDISLEDIGEGVNYYGGFQVIGARISGVGDDNTRARLEIYNHSGERVLQAFSTNFDILKGQLVVSLGAEVSLYFDGDSIYHPNIKFYYDIPPRRIRLMQGRDESTKVPFFDSYHEMEFSSEKLVWAIDGDSMVIGSGRKDADFESISHFDYHVYEKYKNITTVNPIVKFTLYSKMVEKDNKERMEQNPNLTNADLRDPRSFHGDDLARMLDKRLERRYILTSAKMEELKDEPAKWAKFKSRVVDLNELDSYLKNPSHDLSNTMSLYMEMVKDGFILFDEETNMITLRDKLFHYYNAAQKQEVHDNYVESGLGKKERDADFDIIKVKSKAIASSKDGVRDPTKKNQSLNENAVFRLSSKELIVRNPARLALSDSQRVYMNPDVFEKDDISIKKGRNMEYDGVLDAGYLSFRGRNFEFDYANFSVTMDSIETINIDIEPRVAHRTMVGRYTEEEYDPEIHQNRGQSEDKLFSTLSSCKGILFIDFPRNKSGQIEALPEFPLFEASSSAKVYYDMVVMAKTQPPENLGFNQKFSFYPKEDFYFEIEEGFEIDSLATLNPQTLFFDGKMVSADIFPEFEERLRVMFFNLSLGFETETPSFKEQNGKILEFGPGYPVYLREDASKKEGKGKFAGIFGVSNEGLIGLGKINYLGANIRSDYIEFLPEQMYAEADTFELEQVRGDVEFPEVKGYGVFLNWVPYSDSMFVESDKREEMPFNFFEDEGFTLDGNIVLTPEGLLGEGIFDWEEATMESNPGSNFKFKANGMESQSCELNIKSLHKTKFAFHNNDVQAYIDFDKQHGNFVSNFKEDLSADLPYNSYKTSLDEFNWDMAEQRIYITSTEEKAGFFLDTQHEHDSLTFLGKRADYDLETGLLQIDSVEFIRVADAFVYPKDQHVEIEERAYMRTLYDSRIVADTLNKNHVIQRAKINILSRREYKASGFLEFNVGDKEQEIQFDNVRAEALADGQIVTKGGGNVSEEDQFYIDDKMRFYGNVNLTAVSKDLSFEGFAKIESSRLAQSEWFSIESPVDKKNVAIQFDTPKNPEGQTLHAGLYLNRDSVHIYPRVLMPKKALTDRDLFTTRGVLRYDAIKDEFILGDSAKVMGDALRGQKLVVSEATGRVDMEGQFDFGKGFNFITVQTAGSFNSFLDSESDLTFRLSTNVKMIIPESLTDFIIADIEANEEDARDINYFSPVDKTLKNRLAEFEEDPKKLDRLWKKLENTNHLVPDFEHSFFFSGMDLLWSDKTQSFITKGDLELASINGKHIDKRLRGALELRLDVGGNGLSFYIISPSEDWYFFTYQSGMLLTVSSNAGYNDLVASLKKRERSHKMPGGLLYTIMNNTTGSYDSFKRKAQAAHR